MILHKSQKDWTSKVHTFKNFTNVKVTKYNPTKYNLFIDDYAVIDKFVTETIGHCTAKIRLEEAFKLIKGGAYINIYQLLINNDVSAQSAKTISMNISTKNPRLIYKNNEGHRYNINKVSTLYFNIVDLSLDVLDCSF